MSEPRGFPTFFRGVYHGPKTEFLGKTALLRAPEIYEPCALISIRNVERPAVMVQFDDLALAERMVSLSGRGWTAFASEDFTIYPEPAE